MKVFLLKSLRDSSYNQIVGVYSSWELADAAAQEFMQDIDYIAYTRLTVIREWDVDSEVGARQF